MVMAEPAEPAVGRTGRRVSAGEEVGVGGRLEALLRLAWSWRPIYGLALCDDLGSKQAEVVMPGETVTRALRRRQWCACQCRQCRLYR